jgi:hypothetical protein
MYNSIAENIYLNVGHIIIQMTQMKLVQLKKNKMNLNQWAIKWGVPFEAIQDLRYQFGIINTDVPLKTGESETAIQTRVRLEASQKGSRLWRNNVGAFRNETGAFIRFGLLNDSKQLNKNIKSSDLIGIKPILITHEHVGQLIGQFLAREIKPSDWKYTGTDREKAQLKFIELIASLGGDACFAINEGTL